MGAGTAGDASWVAVGRAWLVVIMVWISLVVDVEPSTVLCTIY